MVTEKSLEQKVFKQCRSVHIGQQCVLKDGHDGPHEGPKHLSIQTGTDTQTGRLVDTHTDRLCPLMTFIKPVKVECVGPDCAWFDFENDACAVLALVRVLDALYDWESARS